MARMFVRTTWSSDLTQNGRTALTLLSDHDHAGVSGRPTEVTSATLNIHSETALVLVRQGYAERIEDARIKITLEGLRKIGKLTESRSERRRRREAESLEAQASGEWVPAPAGASAAASKRAAEAQAGWAEAHEEVRAAQDQLEWERDYLDMCRDWGADETTLNECKRSIAKAEGYLAEARARVEALRARQQKAA